MHLSSYHFSVAYRLQLYYYAVHNAAISQLQYFRMHLAADVRGCVFVCEDPRHS